MKELEGKLNAMAGHVLTLEHEHGVHRSWMCRNPKDSNAWFRLVTAPDMACVYGDIGDRIVYRPSTGDIVPWMRGSVHSVGYLISKMPGDSKSEFDPNRVVPAFMERLREARADRDFAKAREWLEAIRDVTSFGDPSEDYTHERAFDVDQDYGEWCGGFYKPTGDVCWTVAALQTFVRLLDAEDERRAS